MITIPSELGEVQTAMGLKNKGSWILSTRNPQYSAPSNTALPEGPEYSQEVSLMSASDNTGRCSRADTMCYYQILDEFRSLRWMGTVPKHLVPNAQILLVGESSGIEKATEPEEKDKQDEDTNETLEEMEELEHEDLKRMEHLGKTDADAIFLDLEAYSKDHREMQKAF